MTLIVTAILTALLFINRETIFFKLFFFSCAIAGPEEEEEDNDFNVSGYPEILINVRERTNCRRRFFFSFTAAADLLALSIRNRKKKKHFR